MKQLFLDLSMPINAHMPNRQKRYVCYRFYTRMRHGVLTAGDRRTLCQCVANEVDAKSSKITPSLAVTRRDIK